MILIQLILLGGYTECVLLIRLIVSWSYTKSMLFNTTNLKNNCSELLIFIPLIVFIITLNDFKLIQLIYPIVTLKLNN